MAPALLVMTACALSAGGAQQPSEPQRQRSLRATTRLVQVDVIATDSRGAPVTGLTKEDFRLMDGGAEESISVFAVAERGNQPATVKPAAPNTFSNRVSLARRETPQVLYVVLFDGLNTKVTDQAYARQHIVKFLRSVQPGNLVAIYTLGNGLRVAHDFTSDYAALARIAQKLAAVTDRYDSSSPDIAASESPIFGEFAAASAKRTEAQIIQNRVQATLGAIDAIARHLGGFPGRKNLIWVSASFPMGINLDRVEYNYARLDVMRSFSEEVSRAMRAVNDANMAIYPVDSRGLEAPVDQSAKLALGMPDTGPLTQIQRRGGGPPAKGGGGGSAGGTGSSSGGGSSPSPSSASTLPPDSRMSTPFDIPEASRTQSTMRELADLTGGRAFYNTNDLAGALEQAMNDSRLTYVLAYYPSHNKWDGRFREIKVQVKRPGLQLRFRRGYFAAENVPVDKAQAEGVLRQALEGPLEASGVSLEAAVQPTGSGVGPGDFEVKLLVAASDVSLTMHKDVHAGAIDLRVELADESGAALWQEGQRITLSLRPETYARIQREGFSFRIKVPAEPRATVLRAAVSDVGTGALGTLRIPMTEIRTAAGR